MRGGAILDWVRGRDGEIRDPLEAALRARVARPSERAADRNARITFTPRDRGAAWTIRFRRGEVTLARGRDARADSTLLADRDVLVSVLEGSRSGVEEFLSGRLFVRGNLALPLELDDLLHPHRRDARTPRCRRVNASGVETFFLEAGEERGERDTPIVFLHGLGATSASFLPTLWELARDRRVYAVDFPGFGESGKPVRPLHAAYFARWLVAFFDAVGIARADVVGNSMGGRVAIEVALRSPDRVRKIALLTPSLAWRRFRFGARVVRLLRPELAAIPIPILHAIALRSIRSMFAHPDRVPAPAMSGAADEFVRYFATARGRIAFFSAMREIYLEKPDGRRGFWSRLSTLQAPALFVFGAKDHLVPHRFQRYVQRAVPHGEFVLLDECGHVPQFELPDRTNALLRDFFDRA